MIAIRRFFQGLMPVLVAAAVAGLVVGAASARRPVVAAGPVGAPAAARPAAASVVPQAMAPVLNYLGPDDICRSWLAVQNLGRAPTKALLVGWKGLTSCGADCAVPVGVSCSGLINPGGAWHFLGAQIPTNSASAIVFGLSPRTLAELGAAAAFNDLTADYLCATVLAGADCAAFARFKAAADSGGEFGGVSMAAAAGEPLAVSVLRNCPGDKTPGVEVSSTYGALSSIDGFATAAVPGGYLTYAGAMHSQAPDLKSVLYVQNAGAACASVELWFKRAGSPCAEDSLCKTVSVAPGTAARVAVADCVGADWAGGAWVKSDQPVAVVVDEIGRDTLATRAGSGALPAHDAAGLPVPQGGGTTAFAPIVAGPIDGSATSITVQNLDYDRAGRARVTLRDADGTAYLTTEVELCPHGVAQVDAPATQGSLDTPPGSALVESLPVGALAPVAVSAVVRL